MTAAMNSVRALLILVHVSSAAGRSSTGRVGSMRQKLVLEQKELAHANVTLTLKATDHGAEEPAQPESAGEQAEEANLRGTAEEGALHGAIGAPHESQGLESDVPRTMAEDSLEQDHALSSVHGLAANVVVPASAIFLFCLMIGNILSLSKYTQFIPESALILAASVFLGVILRKSVSSGYLSMETFTVVNASLLNLVLLPIIMFNSGWALQKANFMAQFEYILIFAIFGTLISTFFIGFASYSLANHFGLHVMTSLRANFVFAALISAVDPVATLASYEKAGVAAAQPLLNIMVFGESAINDAVAIVIFDVINHEWDELNVGVACGDVAYLLLGSIAFGVFLASVLILLMRLARLPGHQNPEILYIWASAYFIYALSETMHLSGIIANLFAGMMFAIYGKKHLNKSGNKAADDYLKLSGEIADTAVFIMCGCSTAFITSWAGVKYGFIAVVLCLIARALSVPACAAVSNVLKNMEEEHQRHRITWRHQIAMWHGGLRGGIALVLALEIDGTWCHNKGMIINATFIVISTLLLFLGSTTDLLLGKLGFIPEGGITEEDEEKAEGMLVDDPKRMYVRFFKAMDSLFSKVLVGDGVADKENMTKEDWEASRKKNAAP